MKLKGVRNSSLKPTAKFAKAMVAKGDHYFPGPFAVREANSRFPLRPFKNQGKVWEIQTLLYVFHAWKNYTIDFLIHVINMCAVFLFSALRKNYSVFFSFFHHLAFKSMVVDSQCTVHAYTIPYYISSAPKAVGFVFREFSAILRLQKICSFLPPKNDIQDADFVI